MENLSIDAAAENVQGITDALIKSPIAVVAAVFILLFLLLAMAVISMCVVVYKKFVENRKQIEET